MLTEGVRDGVGSDERVPLTEGDTDAVREAVLDGVRVEELEGVLVIEEVGVGVWVLLLVGDSLADEVAV